MKPPVKFALGVVAVLLALTAALGAWFYTSPVSIGVWMARSALEGAGLEKSTVDAPRGPQTYFHGGAGPKTVVLVHGMGHQAGSWAKVVADLADRHAVIVPDLAGHGESAPATGSLDYDDSAAGLDAVLDAAAPDRPVVLVGNSMGGWISLRWALAHPDRVERIVLVNSSGIPVDLGDLKLLPTTREEALALVRAVAPSDAPDPAGFVLDDLVEEIHSGPSPRQAAGLRATDFVEDRLGEIEIPVEIVWGLEDDLLPPEYGRKFYELLPDARFHPLPKCGHIPQQQCPQEFSLLLFDLLEREPRRAPAEDPFEPDEEEPVDEAGSGGFQTS